MDPILFHHHGVWFDSIFKNDILNGASNLDGDTRINYVEGLDSVFLVQSDKVLLKWCGHMQGTGIKIKVNLIYCCHLSRS